MNNEKSAPIPSVIPGESAPKSELERKIESDLLRLLEQARVVAQPPAGTAPAMPTETPNRRTLR